MEHLPGRRKPVCRGAGRLASKKKLPGTHRPAADSAGCSLRRRQRRGRLATPVWPLSPLPARQPVQPSSRAIGAVATRAAVLAAQSNRRTTPRGREFHRRDRQSSSRDPRRTRGFEAERYGRRDGSARRERKLLFAVEADDAAASPGANGQLRDHAQRPAFVDIEDLGPNLVAGASNDHAKSWVRRRLASGTSRTNRGKSGRP